VGARELGDRLREGASRHLVPGAAIGVLLDGDTTTAYFGVANVTSGERVTSETRFSIGSLAKSMVATVIARLAEAGRLSLNDPVAAHVPELHLAPWAERATVRALLANRSGLPLRAALEFDFSAAGGSEEGRLSRFAARVAEAEPTTAVWSYTNAGWCLLGRLIETVTGLTWENAMRTHLLVPAGMAQTTFAAKPVEVPRVMGHRITSDGAVPVSPLDAPTWGPAGTTMISTVADMLRFAALHLEDRSLALMRDSQTDVGIYGWFDAWCHGWARFDWDGGPVWGWDGVINGERAFLRLVPDQRGAVVLMTNGSTGRSMYRSLFPGLFEEAFAIHMPPLHLEPSASTEADLARFAGVYSWPDRQAEVKTAGTRLVINDDGAEMEARPIDDRTFLVDANDPDTPTVTFGAFDGWGQPRALYLMLWGLPRQGS
jgi:CubicO group peptidase (beta-lactamase class C family)